MDSELARLMPNNLQQGLQDPSLNTAEIRKYMQGHPVLTERGNIPAQAPHNVRKQRLDDLELRRGSGRVPQAKRFCIRIKRPHGASPLPPATENLDPEELKDALLQQAIAQRRALVTATLRQGSGRVHTRGKFNIVIRRPVLPQPLLFDDPSAGPATSSQLAQLANKTPAGLLAHYSSPLEGVPERLLSGQRNQRVVLGSTAGYAAGFSPVEGLGEIHQVFRPPAPPSRLGSNTAPGAHASTIHGDDSPVEGLVQDAAAGGIGQPRLVSAGGGFAFPSPPHRAEMAVQTGISVDGSAEMHVGDTAPAAFDHDDDDFGGFDDGGGYGGWDDDDYGAAADAAAMPPPPPVSMAPPRPRAPRRPVLNPGVNLRKQLPRKSLMEDVNVGRQEVAPGVRRTTRKAQEPLKWWLNENKEYAREQYKTMPTVQNTTHTDPNTPWRTVTDPKEWKRSKHRYKGVKARGAATKAAPGKGRKARGGGVKNRKAPAAAAAGVEVEEIDDGAGVHSDIDDEIQLRTGTQMPVADSDDEETEILPRTGTTVTPLEGEKEVQGATPTPVRAIDLTSPIDLGTSPAAETAVKGAGTVAGSPIEEVAVAVVESPAAAGAVPSPTAGAPAVSEELSWGEDAEEEEASGIPSAVKSKRGNGSRKKGGKGKARR